MGEAAKPGGVAVLSLAPVLMISVEREGGAVRDVHLHPGGQGVWVARMVALLGVRVRLVAPFGGEPGAALQALVARDGAEVSPVPVAAPNAVWISEEHEGEEATWAESRPPALLRHDADALFDLLLAAGLQASVTVLTGDPVGDLVDPGVYSRLAHDLHAVEGAVVGDLSGRVLRAALEGGLDVAKVSHEELVDGGWASGDSEDELRAGVEALRAAGAGAVLVSRAAEPLLAHDGTRHVTAATPDFAPRNERGAGDSMTGALASALARGRALDDALRCAVAAGALNVRRQGLGTGTREAIGRLAETVRISPAPAPSPPGGG
jgi:1-phosphofructokinase